MSLLSPLMCPRCERVYDLHRPMSTRSCGHSMCIECMDVTQKCVVCPMPGKVVPRVDMSTLVCAGCGLHFMHHKTVINQVRILDCGHRSMCQHIQAPTCAICGKLSKTAAVDCALTAIICRVHIQYPDAIHSRQRIKRKRKIPRCPCPMRFLIRKKYNVVH